MEKKIKNKTFIIKRYLVEEFQIDAKNKKEATQILLLEGRSSHIRLLKETCRLLK